MQQEYDPATIMGGLYGDGIIGLKGAFTPDWADRMREDIEMLFDEAKAVPGGALPRGPQRWYVEVHPERASIADSGDGPPRAPGGTPPTR